MWELVAGAAASALGGVLGSNAAARAQRDASKNALREQQRGVGIQLGMLEPQRYLGYNAIQDLNSLYGYAGTPYASASQLNMPTLDGQAVLSALRHGQSFQDILKMGRLGTLNEAEIAKLSNAGLTGDQIQQLMQVPGSAGSGPGGAAPGQPGNFSRFFASPDYNFRRTEGMRGLEQSAAARGGAFSGNALRGLTDFNSNLASGEFGNYFNRLAAMAGIGNAATAQGANAVGNATNNTSNLLMQQGDNRASGIMNGVNAITGSINNGLNLYGYLGGFNKQPKTSPYGVNAGPWYGSGG